MHQLIVFKLWKLKGLSIGTLLLKTDLLIIYFEYSTIFSGCFSVQYLVGN